MRAFLLITVGVALAGCSAEEYCDERLQLEWGEATVIRTDDALNPIRPDKSESQALRRTIEICKDIRPQFDLFDRLELFDGEAWGSANVFLLAVELDDVALLDRLVSEGHSADGSPNSFGISTIWYATNRQARSAFGWAISKGIDPNLGNIDGVTPLHLAADQSIGGNQYVKLLLAEGVEVDPLALGWTPLAIAIRKNNFDSAIQLIAAGANADVAKKIIAEAAHTVPSKDAAAGMRAALESFEDFRRNSESE